MNLHVFWCLYPCLNELILLTVYNSLARCILNERCLFEPIVVHFQPIFLFYAFVLYTQIRFILSIVSFHKLNCLCTPESLFALFFYFSEYFLYQDEMCIFEYIATYSFISLCQFQTISLSLSSRYNRSDQKYLCSNLVFVVILEISCKNHGNFE